MVKDGICKQKFQQDKEVNMNNQALFPTYAHFNDFYRNTMKGELHGDRFGYTMGNKHLSNKAMEASLGSPHLFTSPNQSINYVECHDNLTYYDKMLLTCGFENQKFKDCQDFANHLIAILKVFLFIMQDKNFIEQKKVLKTLIKSRFYQSNRMECQRKFN
jgi:pullulanase